MDRTIALQFLTLLLFFFMNGQGINARDLKVELRDHKQVDSNEEPYIDGYKTRIHGPNELYLTSYGIHDTKKSYYITGYKTHVQYSNEPYLTGYDNHEIKQPDYTTGYRTQSHDSNKPYITTYGKHKSNNPDYIAAWYMTHPKESNGPYIATYSKHETNQPYITQYRPTFLDLKGLTSPNSKDLEGPASANMDSTKVSKATM